jgi:hypothetical protein
MDRKDREEGNTVEICCASPVQRQLLLPEAVNILMVSPGIDQAFEPR